MRWQLQRLERRKQQRENGLRGRVLLPLPVEPSNQQQGMHSDVEEERERAWQRRKDARAVLHLKQRQRAKQQQRSDATGLISMHAPAPRDLRVQGRPMSAGNFPHSAPSSNFRRTHGDGEKQSAAAASELLLLGLRSCKSVRVSSSPPPPRFGSQGKRRRPRTAHASSKKDVSGLRGQEGLRAPGSSWGGHGTGRSRESGGDRPLSTTGNNSGGDSKPSSPIACASTSSNRPRSAVLSSGRRTRRKRGLARARSAGVRTVSAGRKEEPPGLDLVRYRSLVDGASQVRCFPWHSCRDDSHAIVLDHLESLQDASHAAIFLSAPFLLDGTFFSAMLCLVPRRFWGCVSYEECLGKMWPHAVLSLARIDAANTLFRGTPLT